MGQHIAHPSPALPGHKLRRRGCTPNDHTHTHERQHAGQPKQTAQTNPSREQGRHHQGQGEHQTDAAAHQSHGLGAHLVPRQVGQQGRDSGRHGPCPLQAASDQQTEQVGGRSRPKAAQGKNHQAQHNDPLAPKTVRGHAKGQLQQALREAINTHRQAQPNRVFATGVAACLQSKHGQNQKQTQHAQRKYAGQGGTGTAFGGRHVQGMRSGIRRGIGHKRTQKAPKMGNAKGGLSPIARPQRPARGQRG